MIRILLQKGGDSSIKSKKVTPLELLPPNLRQILSGDAVRQSLLFYPSLAHFLVMPGGRQEGGKCPADLTGGVA
jgi:hypothetical protein